MTTHQQRPTATIYEFPTRPRAASGNHRQAYRSSPQQASAQFPSVECGNGWYHEAAIDEDEQDCDLSHQQH
jgi:hypothetical protein